MNRPLREHYTIPTDAGEHLAVFAYIKALEEYIEYLEGQPTSTTSSSCKIDLGKVIWTEPRKGVL